MKKVLQIVGLASGVLFSSLCIAPYLSAEVVEGRGAAVFINPSLDSAVLKGVETDFFSWGEGNNTPSSSLNFSGENFRIETGTEFSLGKLIYFNGNTKACKDENNISYYADKDSDVNSCNLIYDKDGKPIPIMQPTFVDLKIDITFADPSGIINSFEQTLELIDTRNNKGSTPEQNADQVVLNFSNPETELIINGNKYFLNITGFKEATGAGSTTLDRLKVFEEGFVEVKLFATICSVANNRDFYRDADGDGYGDANVRVEACAQPAGYVPDNTDCNDNDANIYPGAIEVCDGKDNNCDGEYDEKLKTIFYQDADKDGYGNDKVSRKECKPPDGYVTDNTDCNDNDSNIHPGAVEVCDGKDNNCVDGTDDEGVKISFYADTDKDGYGNKNQTAQACIAPPGYVADNTDCIDTNAAINPKATEVCDNIDNDCDGAVDEGVTKTFYRDADKDGSGNSQQTIQACSAPAGYVDKATDCDDTNNKINLTAAELCDGIDNNCNDAIDERVKSTFYRDSDNDGYGDPQNIVRACTPPLGYVVNKDDCNDKDQNIYPGVTQQTTCGGLGACSSSGIETCSAGVWGGNTCVPGNPGAEICDNIDNDCDGVVDEDLTQQTTCG
ncbi:MAG: putative metal-binding motif-containing protein, partial [Candidatus Schekmanbacteria bacterium]|nr:putative metal-binding motif-containing protein [Candidatus Schekmanbacteria bacterium]